MRDHDAGRHVALVSLEAIQILTQPRLRVHTHYALRAAYNLILCHVQQLRGVRALIKADFFALKQKLLFARRLVRLHVEHDGLGTTFASPHATIRRITHF